MIKFEHVFLQYVSEFFSLYDFSCEIDSNTLFVGDFFDGTTATPSTCSDIAEGTTFNADGIIKLSGDSVYVDNIKYADGKLTGSLNITPDAIIGNGLLSGSTYVTITY